MKFVKEFVLSYTQKTKPQLAVLIFALFKMANIKKQNSHFYLWTCNISYSDTIKQNAL